MDAIRFTRIKVGRSSEKKNDNIPDNTPISQLQPEYIRKSWLLFLRNLWSAVIPKQTLGGNDRAILNIYDDWSPLTPLEAFIEARNYFSSSLAKIIFLGVTEFSKDDHSFELDFRLLTEFGTFLLLSI